jgi:hypothetical protein
MTTTGRSSPKSQARPGRHRYIFFIQDIVFLLSVSNGKQDGDVSTENERAVSSVAGLGRGPWHDSRW